MNCRIQRQVCSWISAAAQNRDSTRRALLPSAFLCVCLMLLFWWTRSSLGRNGDCREPSHTHATARERENSQERVSACSGAPSEMGQSWLTDWGHHSQSF